MDLMPLWLSLKISAVATIFTFIAATPIAWRVSFIRKGKGLIDSVFTLAMVLPPTVVGFLLLILLGKNSFFGKFLSDIGADVIFTWKGAVIAAFAVSFPVMYRGIRGAIDQVDRNIIDAGRTLGMSEPKIFLRLILPAARPGVAASIILSFARAIGEFGATLMVAGNIPGKTQTMSVAVYSAMQSGNRERAWIWVAIILIFSFVILTIMNFISMKGERRHGS